MPHEKSGSSHVPKKFATLRASPYTCGEKQKQRQSQEVKRGGEILRIVEGNLEESDEKTNKSSQHEWACPQTLC